MTSICGYETWRECVHVRVWRFSVPALQARESTVKPPSMGSAPAGPGAARGSWWRDPVLRCFTASGTTPPVSQWAVTSCPPAAEKSKPRHNWLETWFNTIPAPCFALPPHSTSPWANPVCVIVYTEISMSIQIRKRRRREKIKCTQVQITHRDVSKLKTKHDKARRGEHPLWKMMLLYEDLNDPRKRNAERKSKDKSPLSETLKPINSPGVSTIDCVVWVFFILEN